METILTAKIINSQDNSKYKNNIGKIIKVKPFTHNSYISVEGETIYYRVRDLKILK